MFVPNRVALAAFSMPLLLAGCAERPGDAPDLAEVTGTITVDGQPAAWAMVYFLSKDRGLQAVGTTDGDGTFRLMYKRGVSGAPVAEHVVTVETGTPEGPERATTIPGKYADRKTCGLEAVVTAEGPNDFAFNLISD